MEFSDELIAQIKRHEGLRTIIYSDSLGYKTVGYGHKLLPDEIKMGAYEGGISVVDAEHLLLNDLSIIIEELLEKAPWIAKLDAARRDVFYNMAFNMGAEGLLGFHQTLSFAHQGLYSEAAIEMKTSKWFGQVGARCRELSNQMKTGKYQDEEA